MKLIAVAACADDGHYRLPLTPGRYAIFIGQSWRYIDVRPHQWLRIALPSGDIASPCKRDSDCLWSGYVCQTYSITQSTTRLCGPHDRIPTHFYNSGVQGRARYAAYTCGSGGGQLMPDAPVEGQCVEAFADGSPYIAACAACAACRFSDGAFVLPLPPGRYTLEFKLQKEAGFDRETHSGEVVPGRWLDLYALGAKPGQIPVKPCPNLPCTFSFSRCLSPLTM
jgi:hypothetical protein